jgi:formylmethanofuran dehydrogenase subunit B
MIGAVDKLTTISSVACPFCGCLCDDIEVTVEDGKITQIKNGCFLSKAKFGNFNNKHRIKKPLIRKNGKLVEVSYEEAIHKSALILAEANYPVLYGWSSTSCEAQRIGVELAEQVGGVFDNTSSVCHGPTVLALQEVGLPSCTLGQVRHRADLILYWGCDPLSSHPRHLQRYTFLAEGRFEKSRRKNETNENTNDVQRKGLEELKPSVEAVSANPDFACQTLRRKSRKLIVVDVRKTLTASIADFFLKIEPNKDFEIIQALRTLV